MSAISGAGVVDPQTPKQSSVHVVSSFEAFESQTPQLSSVAAVSYTHLTLPTKA